MENLFIAEIVDTVQKNHVTEENYLEKMHIYITRLNVIVKNITKKDLLDTSNAERIVLIEYTAKLFSRRNYLENFYDDVNFLENEMLKLFVSELIKHKELSRETIQTILQEILKMLFLESQKAKNKNLNYPKIKFYYNLRKEFDELNKINSIMNYLEHDIIICLDFNFDLNLINRKLNDLNKYEFEKIKEKLLDENNSEIIEKYYSLTLLKKKISKNEKFLNKILYDLSENIMKNM